MQGVTYFVRDIILGPTVLAKTVHVGPKLNRFRTVRVRRRAAH